VSSTIQETEINRFENAEEFTNPLNPLFLIEFALFGVLGLNIVLCSLYTVFRLCYQHFVQFYEVFDLLNQPKKLTENSLKINLKT
jgi:hypothetical protein